MQGNQNQKEDPNRLRVEFPNSAIASGTPTVLGRLINRVAGIFVELRSKNMHVFLPDMQF